jgi:hypothetical protein
VYVKGVSGKLRYCAIGSTGSGRHAGISTTATARGAKSLFIVYRMHGMYNGLMPLYL